RLFSPACPGRVCCSSRPPDSAHRLDQTRLALTPACSLRRRRLGPAPADEPCCELWEITRVDRSTPCACARDNFVGLGTFLAGPRKRAAGLLFVIIDPWSWPRRAKLSEAVNLHRKMPGGVLLPFLIGRAAFDGARAHGRIRGAKRRLSLSIGGSFRSPTRWF